MKEKELTKKELLALEVGMKYDEVAQVFSEDTLSTMTMAHIVGGLDDTYSGNCVAGCNTNCEGAYCVAGCTETKTGKCGDKETYVGVCNTGDPDIKALGCGTTPTVKPVQPTKAG